MKRIQRKALLRSRLEIILSWLLGAVFLVACREKLMEPAAFAQVIHAYQILPDFLINAAAVLLPWLELLAGICLITGFWRSGAAAICASLMAVFISASIFNLARGLNISCGCFSNTTELVTSTTVIFTLIRDSFFLDAALVLIWILLIKPREMTPA